MSVRTSDKRAFLRGIKYDADAARLKLKTALMSALRGQVQEVSTGKVLIGTAANGQTVNFALPSSFDAAAALRVVSDLVDLYEESEGLVSDPTNDGLIYAQMLDLLRPVRSYTHDHTHLRC